jgi:hypothetical protein
MTYDGCPLAGDQHLPTLQSEAAVDAVGVTDGDTATRWVAGRPFRL